MDSEFYNGDLESGEYEAEGGARYLKDFGHELYPEHYEQAIEQFTTERLQSYYLKRPDMAKTAIWMMQQATELSGSHPTAALLFASSAVEITIKHLLVKPIVNGLVHNEAVADVVMALTPPQTGSDAFKNLLFGVLKKVAYVDLATHKRVGSNLALWDEWKQLQKARNDLIHDGVTPSKETLGSFEPVVLEFLNVVFPTVLANLGLKVSGYQIMA
jgi:hypothetical protein